MNTYTQEMNGIKYSIKVDDALYFQSQLLWKTIQDIPADEIKDGFKIEIGFSLYILQKSERGYGRSDACFSDSNGTDRIVAKVSH